jgi:hypothetical protein
VFLIVGWRARVDLECLRRGSEKFYRASEVGNRIITLRNRVSPGAHFIKGGVNWAAV